jgi:hypothetical protein
MTDFLLVYFLAFESLTDFYFLSPFATGFYAFSPLPLLLLFDFYDLSSPAFFLLLSLFSPGISPCYNLNFYTFLYIFYLLKLKYHLHLNQSLILYLSKQVKIITHQSFRLDCHIEIAVHRLINPLVFHLD